MYNHDSQEKVKSYPDVVGYCKELPSYNKYIEKPKIKHLKNIDLLSELPFLLRTECNKDKSCVQRICNELQS